MTSMWQWQVIVCLVCTSVYGRACGSLHLLLRAGSLSTLLYSSSWLPHEELSVSVVSLPACPFISFLHRDLYDLQTVGNKTKKGKLYVGWGYCSNFTALEAPVRLVNVTLKRNNQWLVVATDREICIWRVPQQRPCYYNIFLGNVCSLGILSHQKNK